ncbi:MAG: hypothetical protein AVDCRST_MAG93-149 [uncultured Chloroflexia bacterium]|uniref:Uncharacterized protein n=1 Tax=uncultured Chloroflexia bacterium TaxID=1672391 RepID=A0A6J4H5V2_9CHLR|nr:MAG: hypothetical protein AVDCRST_MAG93-149 [uncultured Chloroflexia bacterium]
MCVQGRLALITCDTLDMKSTTANGATCQQGIHNTGTPLKLTNDHRPPETTNVNFTL